MDVDEKQVARKTREPEQQALFDLPPAWRDEWWGMPEFEMGDATTERRITVNFFCVEDVQEFARLLGVRLTPWTDSMWFPPEDTTRPNTWCYDDES